MPQEPWEALMRFHPYFTHADTHILPTQSPPKGDVMWGFFFVPALLTSQPSVHGTLHLELLL